MVHATACGGVYRHFGGLSVEGSNMQRMKATGRSRSAANLDLGASNVKIHVGYCRCQPYEMACHLQGLGPSATTASPLPIQYAGNRQQTQHTR